MDRLGDTVEAIAFEKAGILKPDGSAITGATGGALSVIEQAAAERGTALWRLGKEIELSAVAVDEAGARFDVSTPAGRLAGLHTPMLGAHQAANGALAAAAALRLQRARRHPRGRDPRRSRPSPHRRPPGGAAP